MNRLQRGTNFHEITLIAQLVQFVTQYDHSFLAESSIMRWALFEAYSDIGFEMLYRISLSIECTSYWETEWT